MSNSTKQHQLPFAFSRETAQLNDEIEKRITKQAMALRDNLLSSQNVYRIKHGRRWRTMHASDPDEPAEVRSHSTETEVSMTCVVDHDLRQLTSRNASFSCDHTPGAQVARIPQVDRDFRLLLLLQIAYIPMH